MPAKPKPATQTEVVCPKCGNRFPLEATLLDHLQTQWSSQERTRLRREVRTEMSPEIEKLATKQARKLAADEVRESREELSESRRQISSLKRTVTTLQKKLPAGRAQELGVVRQHSLAEILEARFRTDRISMIGRGVAGADVVQTVCDGSGTSCGSILWETKRAANWQKAWLRKLKSDQMAGKHTVAVIVSDVLPDPDRPLVQIDGVWVTTLDVAGDLATVLRQPLLEVATARGAGARRDDLKGRVYDYLAGDEFTTRIISIVETAKRMRDSVAVEQRAFQTRWRERERQIESVVCDVAAVIGDLRGIGAALPAVDGLELPAPPVVALPSAL